MKTLNEVIEAQERCATYPNCHFCFLHSGPMCEWIRDALHYLKAFRDAKDALDTERDRYAEAVKNCEVAENKYKRLYEETSQNSAFTSQITCPKCYSEFVILPEANNPLTWRELRTMEGKPVWVELLKGKWKGWDVIGGFDEDDFGVAMVTVRGDDYYKADLGKTWQAYRKERG